MIIRPKRYRHRFEVMSPHPRIGKLEDRLHYFAQYGVRECWLIHQLTREIEVRDAPTKADTTLEPFSIVLVPISRGLMQPYERLRRGHLAGTTGSRPPALPVQVVPDATGLPMAAAAVWMFGSEAPPYVRWGLVVGVLFLLLARVVLNGREVRVGELRGARVRTSVLVFSVLFFHSFPEGFAIGTAYASDRAGLSLFVILAIALDRVMKQRAAKR